MHKLDPRTPVLVGIGIVEQREKDPVRAHEAITLMSDAGRSLAPMRPQPSVLKIGTKVPARSGDDAATVDPVPARQDGIPPKE